MFLHMNDSESFGLHINLMTLFTFDSFEKLFCTFFKDIKHDTVETV